MTAQRIDNLPIVDSRDDWQFWYARASESAEHYVIGYGDAELLVVPGALNQAQSLCAMLNKWAAERNKEGIEPCESHNLNPN